MTLDASPLPALSPEEVLRYGRHLVMPEVGEEGQRRLKAASVLLVGAGGLGSPLALYLAAAGVGRLGLVDFDRVDASNLQRQVLFGDPDVGRPKLEAAVERLRGINPHVELVPHPVRLTKDNALDLLAGYDIVADGSDNFPTRYLVNDACVLLGKPDVYGSIYRFEGQLSVFWGARGPCYRCLFPEPPPPGAVPSCAEAGVLGVLPGIVGALQANEVLKLALGKGEPLIGRFVLFDALRLRFRELTLRKSPLCPVCSADPTQRELVEVAATCAPDPPAAGPSHAAWEVGPEELARWLEEERPVRLLDVRQPYEHQLCRLPGSLLLPLGELPRRLGELENGGDGALVVYCHHGTRSAQAVAYLHQRGITGALSLAGGIDAWSRLVDPAMPRY